MQNLVVVYFHGYGSSPFSDKVAMLRTKLKVPVYAFHAAIDPEVAVKEVGHNVDMILLDDMHAPIDLLFVGTSLGGWLASKMAAMYDVPAIIINPSATPRTSLQKYGVSEEVCAKYDDLVVSEKNTYFFAEHDEVIDHSALLAKLAHHPSVFVDSQADHRFGGESFEQVIDYIKRLYK